MPAVCLASFLMSCNEDPIQDNNESSLKVIDGVQAREPFSGVLCRSRDECVAKRADGVKMTDDFEPGTEFRMWQTQQRWSISRHKPRLEQVNPLSEHDLCDKNIILEQDAVSLLMLWRSFGTYSSDSWGRPFQVITNSKYEYIEIFSLGVDGKPMTGDDIVLLFDMKTIATMSWIDCEAGTSADDCNKVGHWIDYWGTAVICSKIDDGPFKKVVSAGPDRKFGTDDDIHR